ncbi:MAG TPA: class I SAM-dependent methyltransferase [Aquihabitans sp.]|nr:class I SAM-dependent methyltransferase [Aquihabitans sp.]
MVGPGEREGAPPEASLAAAWEANAADWIAWARTPGHDLYERFHRDALFRLLPPPGRLTVDLGCGEGRVGRDLLAAGHVVVGVDRSPTLAAAAATHEPALPVVLADGVAIPMADASCDLVVAFMSLQDMDRPDAAFFEVARVLEPGGRAVMAVVHPLNGAGTFAGERGDASAPFVIDGSYLEAHRYADDVDRDGLRMRFVSDHRSLASWSGMIEAAGLLVEAMREVGSPDPADRWHRVPLFLHLRLLRP